MVIKRNFIVSDTVNYLGLELESGIIKIGTSSCGERSLSVETLYDIKGDYSSADLIIQKEDRIIVIYHYQGNPSDNIISLLQLCSCISSSFQEPNIRAIDVFVSYMPYLRSHKNLTSLIDYDLFITKLHIMLYKNIYVIDCYYDLPCFKNCHVYDLYINHLNKLLADIYNSGDQFVYDNDNICFVSPRNCYGFMKAWAKDKRAEEFDFNSIIFFKKIDEGGMSMFMNPYSSNPENLVCIILDDIIDSGHTLLSMSRILKKAGAKKVFAYVTHAVFGHNDSIRDSVLDMINNDDSLDKLVITDSIFYPVGTFDKCPKIEILSAMQYFVKRLIDFTEEIL